VGNPTTGLKIPLIIPTGVTSRKTLPRRRKQERQFHVGTRNITVPNSKPIPQNCPSRFGIHSKNNER
jgi:hypothetical protein